MQNYAWPGNIRALRHTIERAIILSQSEKLEIEDFQLQTVARKSLKEADQATSEQHMYADAENNTNEIANNTELNLEKLEKQTILLALKKYNYNISHSAKALGLTRAALYRRMEKYGV